MRNTRTRSIQMLAAAITLCLLAVSFVTSQSGGPYTIKSSVIGAGGHSSGGTYQLSGTIGQFGIGTTMASGPYSLGGGFWHTVASGETSSWAVGGTITYGTTPANLPPRFVPGVDLTADGTPQAFATSDETGFYQFTGLGPGPYLVTLSKTGDVNGISSLDAARIQQHLVSTVTLDAFQQIAGDATGNGTLSSLDAARIQQFLVSQPGSPNLSGQWRFIPAEREYAGLTSNLPNENFVGILIGEVTGNWQPPASLIEGVSKNPEFSGFRTIRRDLTPEATVTVTLPADAMALNGETVTIPVTVSDLTGLGIVAYDFTIFYDPAILEPANPAHDASGTLSSTMNVVSNSVVAGELIVSAATAVAITGEGTLLNLKFTVVGNSAQQTTLTFVNPGNEQNTFLINEGEHDADVSDGLFTVMGPTAAAAYIVGRVLSSDGRAIQKARITLTDLNGVTRSALTNPFGYYRFEDIEVGQTYILDASARGFHFPSLPHVLFVADVLTELDIRAAP
jgi:hypothetical protein